MTAVALSVYTAAVVYEYYESIAPPLTTGLALFLSYRRFAVSTSKTKYNEDDTISTAKMIVRRRIESGEDRLNDL
jgi:hypothetical protein